MNKPNVRDMINNLGVADLERLKADLEGGGKHLRVLVEHRLQEMRKQQPKICATCGKDLLSSSSPYTLVFGPEDFRKKASFCAQDCLSYFLDQLTRMKSSDMGKLDSEVEK